MKNTVHHLASHLHILGSCLMICWTSMTHSLLSVLASASYFRFTPRFESRHISNRAASANIVSPGKRPSKFQLCIESLLKRCSIWIMVCLRCSYAYQHCSCCHSLLCSIRQELNRIFAALLYGTLTCTSHIAQSWWPAPLGRCWDCPRRESPPSAWPARPAGPAAFGWWTGSPRAAHTGPQAVADCRLPSGSMRMYCHTPRPGTGTNKVMMELREGKGDSLQSSSGRGNQERSWQKGDELLNMLV